MTLEEPLIYALIAVVALGAIVLFRKLYPASKASSREMRSLSEKYSRYLVIVDAFSIIGVFLLAGAYSLALSFLKPMLVSLPPSTIFSSLPTTQILVGAFLLAIATAGDAVRISTSALVGRNFWRYYSSLAGFDSSKAYKWIKIVFFLAAAIVLFDGLQHFVAVTDEGVQYYDLFRLEKASYGWSDFSAIERVHAGETAEYFIFRFSDGRKIDTQNEAWNAGEEKRVAEFVSLKTGLALIPVS